MERFLQLTENQLVYYRKEPRKAKHNFQVPLFTIPVDQILEVKPLYQASNQAFLFEVVLKSEYE